MKRNVFGILSLLPALSLSSCSLFPSSSTTENSSSPEEISSPEEKSSLSSKEGVTSPSNPSYDTHYLTYYVDGNVYTSVKLYVNAYLTLPDDPVKEDYTFLGWYFENGDQLSNDYFIGKDIRKDYSVYARFDAIKKEGLDFGVWSGSYHFSLDNHGEKALQDLKDSGIDTIYGLSPKWCGQTYLQMLDKAKDIGISLFPIAGEYNSQTGGYDWDGSAPSWLSKEAVKGVLTTDEPAYTDLDALKSKKTVWDKDPNTKGKMFFLNYRASSFVESADKVSFREYLNAIHSKVSPDDVSTDYYPLLQTGNIFTQYYETLQMCSEEAKRYSLPFYFSLCAAQHNSTSGQLMMPNEDNLSWQVNLALTFGSTHPTYYVYSSHQTDEYTCMADTSGNKLPLYDVVEKVTKEIKTYETTYMDYAFLGSSYYDEGNNNDMFPYMKENLSLSSIAHVSSLTSQGGDILIGAFQHKKSGKLALRITNAGKTTKKTLLHKSQCSFDMEKIDHVKLSLSDSFYTKATLYEGKDKQALALNQNSLDFSLSAYGSAFLVLE